MKVKEITLWALLILVCGGVFGYAFFDNDDLLFQEYAETEIRLEADSLDLGVVKYTDRKKVVFTLQNIGSQPLLIKDVKPSCGCTQAEWNKRPVRPGDAANISLVFAPNSLGRFMKSIDVVCNTPQRIHILKIRGEVEE